MRFIALWLSGLIAVASANAAPIALHGPDGPSLVIPAGERTGPQSGPSGGQWSFPQRKPSGTWITPHTSPEGCPKGTVGKWPLCITVKPPKCPKNTKGKWPDCQEIVRYCPEGTTGKWPKCKPKPTASCAQKGMVGKWPNCHEPDEPEIAAKPCPDGYVRKGKKCVELTKGDDGKKPPRVTKTEAEDDIPPAIAALTAGRPHRPREILVLVDAGRASEIAARLASQYNVTADPRVTIPLLDGALVRLRLPANRSLESLLAALSTDPDVELAQPNYDYSVSKGKASPKTAPQYAGETIRLDEAHRLARGNGIMIAVIDTAIEAAHPELVGTIAGVFDAVADGPSPAEPHGTEIAGILVAHAALTGVAPAAKVLSVRAFRAGKKSPAQSTSLQLLKGINWAFDAGAKIMNMSFTGPLDPLLERIVKAAAEKGVIFIAAAGNNGPKGAPVYPAAYPEVIAVTATDEKDKLYGLANRGDYISIAAPGVDIIAPALRGSYELSSGTSMAAAHVSGVVALLLERDGKLDWNKAREILSASARKPDRSSGGNAFGAGILDAAGALGEPGPSADEKVGAGR
ncbi:MAG TPA: S8 family serine peptidase [Hyphomicrobiaceae bacterium]|nr:S8 family serine peptidase [Hyphomicrobiaceae bacterium]